jgi:hypothetical protein
MTWGEGITTLKFFKPKTVKNLKKMGSVIQAGKVNAGME